MTRRVPILAGVAALVVAAAVVVGFVLAGGEDGGNDEEADDLAGCAELVEDSARSCYATALASAVRASDDPAAEVARIDALARENPAGFLLSNCHGLMHTVGREYAAREGLTLATLMDVLPKSNDPGCSAGFAHGLVTGVAPQIDLSRPQASARVCEDTTTRYQRYSCTHGFGHAFMRLSEEELPRALELCRALGPGSSPDCAQGVYHDYWFAVTGADETKRPPNPVGDPALLCGVQPEEFVRPCWYRAFVEVRPLGGPLETSSDLDALCRDLQGLQREACITGAAVVGPADPRAQLPLCQGFQGREALSCIRGTKVQNLLGQPDETYLELLSRCELFAGATRTGCYEWLGKTITVVTDGEFARTGCPRLRGDARGACAAGAESSEGPLVTFS